MDDDNNSMKTVSVEYGKDNRFPFYTRDKSNVTICFDDHEGLYELDFIFGKIVDRFPSLDPVPFYRRIGEIRLMTHARSITMLKSACDSLLGSIKELFMDEDFIH